MQKVVLATGNAGKVRELASLLEDFGLDIVAQTELGVDSAEETGLTFIENAILKARHAAQITGLPAIADDSGLAVDALGGAPGIYSARYAGVHGDDEANNRKLVEDLKPYTGEDRKGRYVCVVALVWPDGKEITAEGTCEGIIRDFYQGKGGFGYDPYFYVGERSMAELTFAEKDAISHRGRALRALVRQLEEVLA